MLTELLKGIQSYTQTTFGKVWAVSPQEESTGAKVNLLGRLIGSGFGIPEAMTSQKRHRTFSPLRVLWWTSLLFGAWGQRTDPFPVQFELSSLDGTNGFVINGEQAEDRSGYSVSSAGDVNGDGLSDVVIGAYRADPPGRLAAGKSYVVFGSRTLFNGGILELSSLNGQNGFILNGEAENDRSGYSVSSAGDMNGDGLSDVVIGAYQASPSGRFSAGKSYVVFGSRTIINGGTLELSSLDGQNGFILNGETAGDNSGISVSSAGDMNGDGLADMLIGAYGAAPSGRSSAGKSYVVFGRRTLVNGAILELSSLNGQNGFILNGEATADQSGWAVSTAGDMNGDGLSDLVIGAYLATPSDRSSAGKSYVVFGSRAIISGGTFELSSLDGQNGFILNGDARGDNSGYSVSSAGDMNGNGLSDLVIGARRADPSGRSSAGKSYVVFGNRSFVSGGTLELSSLNGQNGMVLNGEAADDNSGRSVSSAGDMNGDGLPDLVIGARYADPSGKSRAGKSYVVFGNHTLVGGGTFELSSLIGTNGFILNGEAPDDISGVSVSSAGDVNGDGLSDLMIGAYYANPSGKSQAGKSYVVFGRNLSQSTLPPSLSIDTPSSQLASKPSPFTTTPSPSNAQTFTIPDASPTQNWAGVSLSTTVMSAFSSAEPLDHAMVIGLSVGGAVLAFGCSVFCGCLLIAVKKNADQNADKELNHSGPTTHTGEPKGNYEIIPKITSYGFGNLNVDDDDVTFSSVRQESNANNSPQKDYIDIQLPRQDPHDSVAC